MRAIILSLALALALPAAAKEPATGNERLDRAVALYDDLEFEQAVALLGEVLAVKGLTRQEISLGYKYLALAEIALDRPELASQAFAELLKVDPLFTLPRGENPKAVDLLEAVRQKLPKAEAFRITSVTPTPVAPRPGENVVFAVAVAGAGQPRAVVLHHRQTGQTSYSTVSGELVGGAWQIVLPGALVVEPGLDYYVVAAGERPGDVLGGSGTADLPFLLTVQAPHRPAAAPIYARWWFWAGTGGLVAALVITAVVLSGGEESDTVPVTITVE